MKNKTLLICHLEPDFNPSENLVLAVEKYSRLFGFWNTIVIESASDLTGTDPFFELSRVYSAKVNTWVWGWPEMDMLESGEDDSIEGVDFIWCKDSLHKGAFIPDWMKKLDKSTIYFLVGGGRWECLQDVKEMMDFLGYDCRIVESLTY
jgi:hypothetical protein